MRFVLFEPARCIGVIALFAISMSDCGQVKGATKPNGEVAALRAELEATKNQLSIAANHAVTSPDFGLPLSLAEAISAIKAVPMGDFAPRKWEGETAYLSESLGFEVHMIARLRGGLSKVKLVTGPIGVKTANLPEQRDVVVRLASLFASGRDASKDDRIEKLIRARSLRLTGAVFPEASAPAMLRLNTVRAIAFWWCGFSARSNEKSARRSHQSTRPTAYLTAH